MAVLQTGERTGSRPSAAEGGGAAPALSPADHWSTSTQLLPGDRAFLSPSPAELLPQNLTPAPRRQDHTTSPSAFSTVRQPCYQRPPHPVPNVRDDRETPLSCGTGWRK